MDTRKIQKMLQQIRQQRSSEGHFDDIYHLLEQALTIDDLDTADKQKLTDIKEKQAAAYRQAHTGNASAWPEFERFVSALEKALGEMNT